MRKRTGPAKRHALPAVVFVLASAATCLFGDEAGSVKTDHKPQPSTFEIRAFNDLMLIAASNSYNNVKTAEPPGSYTVHGRVVDHQGKAVVDAQVMLAGDQRGPDLYLANFDKSDESGRFVVRADQSSRSVFVRVGDLYVKRATGGVENIVVTIPQTHRVSFEPLSDGDEMHDSIYLTPVQGDDAQTQVIGGRRTTLEDAAAGKVQLAVGTYKVTGSRRLVTKDKQTIWGTVQLGDIRVEPKAEQTFKLRPGGVTVQGSLAKLDSFSQLAGTAPGVKVSLLRGEGNRTSVMDVVLCDDEGNFRFEAVPVGDYSIEARTIPKAADVNTRTFGWAPSRGTVLRRQKIMVGEEPLQVQWINYRGQPTPKTTADAIHEILRSEHPQPNVSWSWSDVQVANIIRLQDREGARAELLRLITADETPSDWRYLALRALPSMTPLPEDVVSRLAQALHKPEVGRHRGSILEAIRKMSDGIDAVPIILPLKDDPSWRLRYSVADALGEIGACLIETPDEIVLPLIEFLDDPHGVVRKEAAGALGVLHVAGATEALKRKLDDPFGPARAMIAWALFECSPEDAPLAVSTMIDLLKNSDDEGRREAAYYLRMFDHRAESALPVLEPFLAYDKKPPFSNSDETTKYQLRGAAEKAINTIQASIAWRDADPRFELAVAPIDAKLQLNGTVKWGTAVDGVQLGLAVEAVQKDFVAGQRVPLALLIRNLNAVPIRMEIDRRLPDVSPQVTFGAKRQWVEQSRVLIAPEHVVFDVDPGETCWIAHNGLGLGTAAVAKGLWLPFLKDPKPAPYAISQRYRFELYDTERGTKKRIWLTSGNATFNVVTP
ncbi:MAG: HEAT repeat domain-containing protein [Planctomycetota bacterium]